MTEKPTPPTLIVSQLIRRYSGNIEANPDLSGVASHVRISARLGKGVTSSPVASPGAGVYPNPVHPRAEALPLRHYQAVPPGPDQGAFAPPGPTTRSIPPGPGPAVRWTDQGLVPPLNRAGHCGACQREGRRHGRQR